jgi:hypothetical protein
MGRLTFVGQPLPVNSSGALGMTSSIRYEPRTRPRGDDQPACPVGLS